MGTPPQPKLAPLIAPTPPEEVNVPTPVVPPPPGPAAPEGVPARIPPPPIGGAPEPLPGDISRRAIATPSQLKTPSPAALRPVASVSAERAPERGAPSSNLFGRAGGLLGGGIGVPGVGVPEEGVPTGLFLQLLQLLQQGKQ